MKEFKVEIFNGIGTWTYWVNATNIFSAEKRVVDYHMELDRDVVKVTATEVR